MVASWRQMIVVFNSNQGGWQQSAIDYPVAADDGGSLTYNGGPRLGRFGHKGQCSGLCEFRRRC